MAIYHLSGTLISRSQGRSAVAAAAYRSGEKLQDERYEKTHDYSRKQDVAHTEILLPENAPPWMADREKLWNAVEQVEKRKDAQLAREFNFSLPRELTLEQNIKLACEFVKTAFVDQGMVADVCIHTDKTPDGEPQPHAHVMLTLREVNEQGFGQKMRAWNAKEQLLSWREQWAEIANHHLALHDHELRIDHRSFADQGIDLEPQHKIGAAVAQERMARLADHQRIARENGEKILENPEIALDALTRQQSTFTHHDLARFVSRNTWDSEQFQNVYELVKCHEELVSVGRDEQGRDRFTTQALLQLETHMMKRATALAKQCSHDVPTYRGMNRMAQLTLSQEQQTGLEHLMETGDLACLIGYAGSGKSTLLRQAREAWEASEYHVIGATLSGIAAENLEASSGIPSRTLASLEYQWDQGKQPLNPQSILVIDEAGMVGSRQLARVLEQVEKQGAKAVLMGDPWQLQAIEAGAAFRAISERTPTAYLTEIHRQRLNWQQMATTELAQGKTVEALERYTQHDHVHRFATQVVTQQALVWLWNDARLTQPEHTQIILAYTRAEVQQLNELARAQREKLGELGIDQTIETERGTRLFAEQDRVYFLKNDRDLGVKNGSLGTLEHIQNNVLTIRLDKGDPKTPDKESLITFSTERYNHLDHGYAATVHKAQGVTVDRAYLLASPHLDSHATYVGLTRHRDSVDIFYSREHFQHDQDLAKTLGRKRTKDITLDYGALTQEAEGLKPSEEILHPWDKPITLEDQQRYDRMIKEDAKAYDQLPPDAFDFSRKKTASQSVQVPLEIDQVIALAQKHLKRELGGLIPTSSYSAQSPKTHPTLEEEAQKQDKPTLEKQLERNEPVKTPDLIPPKPVERPVRVRITERDVEMCR